jgi:hypothetical protein
MLTLAVLLAEVWLVLRAVKNVIVTDMTVLETVDFSSLK